MFKYFFLPIYIHVLVIFLKLKLWFFPFSFFPGLLCAFNNWQWPWVTVRAEVRSDQLMNWVRGERSRVRVSSSTLTCLFVGKANNINGSEKSEVKKANSCHCLFLSMYFFQFGFYEKPNGEKKPNNNVATVIATEVSHFLVFMFFTTLTFSLPTL